MIVICVTRAEIIIPKIYREINFFGQLTVLVEYQDKYLAKIPLVFQYENQSGRSFYFKKSIIPIALI